MIDSKVNLPFSAKAVISTTTDGRIRVSPQSVRSLGIPMGPVMNLFGMKLDDLVPSLPAGASSRMATIFCWILAG